MRRACLAAWLATAALSAHAQSTSGADRAAIEGVLQSSAANWSRGDLPAFMRSYERGPNTIYIGRSGLVTGYDAIESRYAAAYPASAGHMGELSLNILDYRPLDAAYVLVTGRFTLTRKKTGDGDATGVFTLLMHRSAAGWRITYDHTS